MRTVTIAIAGAGLLLIGQSRLAGDAADRYRFDVIADTTGDFSAVGAFSAINRHGVVAFKADMRAGGSGVFASDGRNRTRIASLVNSPSEFGSTSINAAGQVVFVATPLEGSRGVFVGDGGPLTTIVRGGQGSFPSLDDEGLVAFDNGDAVFTGRGGPITTIAARDGLFNGLGNPHLNQRDTLLFAASLTAGGQALYTSTAGSLTRVADAFGAFEAFNVFPAINDDGVVAFAGRMDAGWSGVFTTAGGTLTTVADSRTEFNSFEFVALNNRGAVAFDGWLDTGVRGLFTGPDIEADKVVAVGDPLFGSAVTALSFYRDGLNDRGQIVFRAMLADGRGVIVRATPAPALTPFDTFVGRVLLARGWVVTDLLAANAAITLGAGSDGIDPAVETVRVAITDEDGRVFEDTLAGGSFARAGRGRYEYRAPRAGPGVQAMTLWRLDGHRYAVALDGRDGIVSELTPPLSLSLVVGDDGGSVSLGCQPFWTVWACW